MIVAGFDLSLTGTGVCILGPGVLVPARFGMEIDRSNVALDVEKELLERIIWISNHCLWLIDKNKVDVVGVEDYSFGSFIKKTKEGKSTSSASITGLAELNGVVKTDLWRKSGKIAMRLPVKTARATTFGKGWGNKKKDEIIFELQKRKVFFRSEDECDAFVVAAAVYCKTIPCSSEKFWEDRVWESK